MKQARNFARGEINLLLARPLEQRLGPFAQIKIKVINLKIYYFYRNSLQPVLCIGVISKYEPLTMLA
ncbi:MAG TPA: hypothetical protein P5329_14065 [Candidatus Competibacteraceae bacterium]|nr:hypothetical protein [Candidatus Competibacteraceae bacterium]